MPIELLSWGFMGKVTILVVVLDCVRLFAGEVIALVIVCDCMRFGKS